MGSAATSQRPPMPQGAAALAGDAELDGAAPAGNTGAEIASGVVGVGWLGLTVWVDDAAAAVERIGTVLGLDVRARSVATRGYTAAWSIGESSTISTSSQRAGEVHVELTQSDCEGIGARRLHELASWASVAGSRWKCSRFDLNHDDQVRRVEPRAVYEAFLRGDRVSHVEHASMWESSEGGATCYIGSPRSQQQLRVYDADVRHGPGHGVRWEWQGRDELATEMLRVWFALDGEPELSSDGARRAFWARVRRFVDFVDQDSAEHQEDRSPLSWWRELLDGATKMRPRRVDVVPRSFLRQVQWLRDQVAPTLAEVCGEVRRSGHGGIDLLRVLIEDGEGRLRRREARAWSNMAPASA